MQQAPRTHQAATGVADDGTSHQEMGSAYGLGSLEAFFMCKQPPHESYLTKIERKTIYTVIFLKFTDNTRNFSAL